MAVTVEQLKDAARKAVAAGDFKAAQELVDQAQLMEGLAPAQEKVVATTPDGGRVIEGANGLSFTSPSYSTSDPAQVAKIMEGATPADVSTSGFDQQTIAQAPAIARLAKVVQGVPFVGEYTDEMIDAVSPKAAQGTRAIRSAMDRERPKESMGLQVGGGLLGAIPAAAVAGPAMVANAPTSMAAKVGLGGLLGAVTGGTEGAISGYGAGEGDTRGQSAIERGLIGGAFGGAAGALAPIVAKGIGSAYSYARIRLRNGRANCRGFQGCNRANHAPGAG